MICRPAYSYLVAGKNEVPNMFLIEFFVKSILSPQHIYSNCIVLTPSLICTKTKSSVNHTVQCTFQVVKTPESNLLHEIRAPTCWVLFSHDLFTKALCHSVLHGRRCLYGMTARKWGCMNLLTAGVGVQKFSECNKWMPEFKNPSPIAEMTLPKTAWPHPPIVQCFKQV